MSRIFIPDSRFEVPELFEPGRKPSRAVRLTPELLKYTKTFKLFNNQFYTKDRSAWTYTNTDKLVSGVIGNGTSSRVTRVVSFSSLKRWVMLTFVLKDTDDQMLFTSSGTSSSGANLQLGVFGGKVRTLYKSINTGDNPIMSSDAVVAGKLYTAVVVAEDNLITGFHLYLNGKHYPGTGGSTSASPTVTTQEMLLTFRRGSASYSIFSDATLQAHASGYEMDLSIARELSKHPYQFLTPT